MIERFNSKLFIILFLGGISLLLFPSYIFNRKPTGGVIAPAITLNTKAVITGLVYPVDMAFAGNGDILVAEQAGQVRLVKNGVLTQAPLLDLSALLKKNAGYDVRGLLGIELHPKFSTNRKIYVFYSAPSTEITSDHKDIIAEYTLSPNATTVAANSGRILFSAEIPGQGDNGGCLKFGPDGYLYIAMGDGGGPGDKHGTIGNGQNKNTLLGKILRIDVNTASGYAIPQDNPFISKPDVRPEIWAYGLRNPWRFSFDKATKQLFTCDVGEGAWEEMDIIEKGGNYGWRITEGNHCYNPKADCDFNGTIKPIAEYDRSAGVCVIAGYVYNGRQLPSVKGRYFFADWTGPVYYIEKNGAEWQRGKVTLQNYPENLRIISWGEDPAGEMYLITTGDLGEGKPNGAVYKIVGS